MERLLNIPDEDITYFKDEKTDKFGYKVISTKEIIIPPKYNWTLRKFSEGLAVVELNNKYGYIDKTGKQVIPLKYDNAQDFSEGLGAVTLNGKQGFVDKEGRIVIPIKYDYVREFWRGKVMVNLNGEQFYIDKKGNRICDV